MHRSGLQKPFTPGPSASMRQFGETSAVPWMYQTPASSVTSVKWTPTGLPPASPVEPELDDSEAASVLVEPVVELELEPGSVLPAPDVVPVSGSAVVDGPLPVSVIGSVVLETVPVDPGSAVDDVASATASTSSAHAVAATSVAT